MMSSSSDQRSLPEFQEKGPRHFTKMLVVHPEMNVPREPSDTTISYPISVHDAAGMQQRLVQEGVAPLRKFQGRDCDIEEEKKEGMSPPRTFGKERLSSDQTFVKAIRPRGKLRKQVSEPSAGRRAIFRGFWEREAGPNNVAAPAATRRRSASISIPTVRRSSEQELDIRRFAPPSEVVHSMPEYFLSPDALPEESERSLPKLPSPLQRFYKGGKPTSLGGMYPLNAPRSILRESSYREVVSNGPKELNSNHDLPGPSSHVREESFNLTKTRHAFQALDLQESSVSSSTSSGNHRTHFDPRVTVTEYEDHCKREWYSESELESFKYEAINLARQYLLKHPEMIDVYNKPHLDPVTRTMRKKALYSMPVLSTPGEEGLSAHVHDKHIVQQVVDNEVRNILLIDRNQMILDLFRRTLQPLFPRARITAVQSGEEALRLLHMATSGKSRSYTGGYDVVVAEERLRHPLSMSGASFGSGKSDSHLEALARSSGDLLVKHDSSTMDSSSCTGMTGSELFRRIVDMEAAVHRGTQEDALQPSGLLRSLLIGVSMHPEQDAKSFFDNGADFVWGKPPPVMDDSLRDQLVTTLIKKRQSGSKEPELLICGS